MKKLQTPLFTNTNYSPALCSSILFKIVLFFLPLSLCSQELFQTPWGKDTHLIHSKPAPRQASQSLPVRLADVLIRFHQEIISPIDGPRSHFRPSSSRYMQLAMHRYGFLRGFIMGCDRLLRENDETWIYPTVEIDGEIFKYDPACVEKGIR